MLTNAAFNHAIEVHPVLKSNMIYAQLPVVNIQEVPRVQGIALREDDRPPQILSSHRHGAVPTW
jgi:hypothetical protein